MVSSNSLRTKKHRTEKKAVKVIFYFTIIYVNQQQMHTHTCSCKMQWSNLICKQQTYCYKLCQISITSQKAQETSAVNRHITITKQTWFQCTKWCANYKIWNYKITPVRCQLWITACNRTLQKLHGTIENFSTSHILLPRRSPFLH